MTDVAAPAVPLTHSEIVDRLLTIIAREGLVDREKLKLDAPLDELGVKSADVVCILMAIEEEFDTYIPVDAELSEMRTVGDMVNALVARVTPK